MAGAIVRNKSLLVLFFRKEHSYPSSFCFRDSAASMASCRLTLPASKSATPPANRQIHIPSPRNQRRRCRHALDHRRVISGRQNLAAPKCQTVCVIPTTGSRAGQYQIAQSREPGHCLRPSALRHDEPGEFRQPAGDQGGARILAISTADQRAGCDGNHIFGRPPRIARRSDHHCRRAETLVVASSRDKRLCGTPASAGGDHTAAAGCPAAISWRRNSGHCQHRSEGTAGIAVIATISMRQKQSCSASTPFAADRPAARDRAAARAATARKGAGLGPPAAPPTRHRARRS